MIRKQFGKKGIFLTLIAISLIAAFILLFTPSDISLEKDIVAVKTRVLTVNEYVTDMEDVYMERALDATGTKTIIALIGYMQTQNRFLADFDDAFKQVLITGSLDGTPVLLGNTYPDWLEMIKSTADDAFNIKTDFGQITSDDISVYQTSPWLLTIDANISFNVTSETASWSKNVGVRSEIDIQRFNDPYYLVNTAGAYTNRINKSGVSFDQWDINKARDHIRYGTYTRFEDSKAPNFIMRFTNTSLSSSCCGIESLVNPNKPTIGDEMESYADYLYFNHTYQSKCTQLYNLTDLSFKAEFPGFSIDFEHLVLYNLTETAIGAC